MAINIISNNENKLLNRLDLVAEIEFTGTTPSKNQVTDMIATKIGSEKKLIVVKIIKTLYGEQKAIVEAVAYNSIDNLKKLEKYEEPVEEEKPAEAEQPKEETKTEEKTAEAEQPKEKTKTEEKTAEAEQPKEETKTEEKTSEAEQPKEETKAEEKTAKTSE
ncbi:MAG: hypothetical protein ACMXYG_00790 [Candidatus Woesearchaeota archaeon]